jgi:alcohol dehydrogenase
MYGFISVDRAPGLWGGYAEYQYLAPDSMVLPVPTALEPVVATVFNPLGAGIRWGATIPGTGPGDVVAVLGPDIRGLCAAAAAKDAGAEFVMMTGLGARDADRLALASRFGADLVVDVAVDDPVAALRDATGGLADVVVDVTAKAPAAFAQAIELARTAGTVVVAGTRGWGTGAPGFVPDMVVLKESCGSSAHSESTPPRTGPHSTCWRPADIRSRNCRAAASDSMGPRTCSPPWQASVMTRRRCTGW